MYRIVIKITSINKIKIEIATRAAQKIIHCSYLQTKIKNWAKSALLFSKFGRWEMMGKFKQQFWRLHFGVLQLPILFATQQLDY